ncbi:hypothetical protein FKM82_012062 [Ascaphus truei]
MASYFDEHNCEPTVPEEQYCQNTLLELARSLLGGMDIDFGPVYFKDLDHRLPPRPPNRWRPRVIMTPEHADAALKCPVCLL